MGGGACIGGGAIACGGAAPMFAWGGNINAYLFCSFCIHAAVFAFGLISQPA